MEKIFNSLTKSVLPMTEGRLKFISLAFLVTFLWSTSFVIIKIGLKEIPPLNFAGYRYIVASVILLLFTFSCPKTRAQVFELNSKSWIMYSLYGLLFFTITQGTGFLSIEKLPTITVSFGLSLTIIFVLLISAIILRETPNSKQLFFIFLSLLGTLLFFFPLSIIVDNRVGLLILFISILANASSSIVGRGLNRGKIHSPLVITSISMTSGSIGLLIIAQLVERLQMPSPFQLFMILWLAIVNTALTFTLWNYVLGKLTAFETTVIQNSMLPQISILALVFLGETITWYQFLAIIVIIICTILVQTFRTSKEVTK